jgi:ABC-type branched-subunit amino acid transport system substrate-binding protein
MSGERLVRASSYVRQQGMRCVVSAAVLLVTACSGLAIPGSQSSNSASPIKIGVLDDVTGPVAIEGALMRINTDLVVDQINSPGGINGRPVEAVYVDPKGDPTQAVQLATQLAQQDNVDVLTGAILSSECTAVQALAPQFGIVYMASSGCATDTYSTQSCNKYSFRLTPGGKQLIDAATQAEVKLFGTHWGIIYADYAFGQSQMEATDAALQQAGGDLPVKIAVPLGEANVTPYVTQIPTDGSIQALVVSQVGADLARTMAVLQQFGIDKKLGIVTTTGKENYAGVYPDVVNGSIITGIHVSDPAPDNAWDQDYNTAFHAMAMGKDASFIGPLGGASNLTTGTVNGYTPYATMTALKLAMRSSNFTGKADTDNLITALENLNVKQGPDFPAGDVIMNKADHQGRTTMYLLKVNGQKEDILQTIPADQLPLIGNCQV